MEVPAEFELRTCWSVNQSYTHCTTERETEKPNVGNINSFTMG